jgi:hypothetical protein
MLHSGTRHTRYATQWDKAYSVGACARAPTHLVTNCVKWRRDVGTTAVAEPLATSKYMAKLVEGSMPPSIQEYVPPSPTSVSLTLAFAFFNELQGPIAPVILNSREVCTSNCAAKPMNK